MRIAYNAHHTGGGIVADSNPEAEWDETIYKSKSIIGRNRKRDAYCVQCTPYNIYNGRT